MGDDAAVGVYLGDALARYNFGPEHPFGPFRYDAFRRALDGAGLTERCLVRQPVQASRADLLRFHSEDYVARVERLSGLGRGFLDLGDTPAFRGMFEATAYVVGSVLDALTCSLQGICRRAFVPIAGLHHARREGAAGFCVFNDCGVAIETLRAVHGVRRVGYVDIDAHHSDGVFYSFVDDPDLIYADIHESGDYLFPGTGRADETGRGAAEGTKLNVPLPPGADDARFRDAWEAVEAHLGRYEIELLLLQCGADSMAGDPLTGLAYSQRSHAHAAARLSALADRCCEGRLIAMGGGGYSLENLAAAWTAVVEEMLRA